jgi:hypothetical protein
MWRLKGGPATFVSGLKQFISYLEKEPAMACIDGGADLAVDVGDLLYDGEFEQAMDKERGERTELGFVVPANALDWTEAFCSFCSIVATMAYDDWMRSEATGVDGHEKDGPLSNV